MKKKYRNPVVLTLLLTSFSLGVVFSTPIKEFAVKNISKTHILWKKSILSTIKWEVKNTHWNISRSNIITEKLENIWVITKNDLDLKSFWNVYSIIKKDYYNLDDLNKEDLINWATKGLVFSLKDKHSEFMDAKENESFSNLLSGDFEGIGAVVDDLEFWVKIERILKWSPAEKHGLYKNDIIIEANNEKLEWLTLIDAVAKIKGPAWTHVVLKILRTWEDEALEIKVIRWKIIIPSVEEKYFEKENIGYIALNLFGKETSEEFKKALKSMETHKAEWVIIDLRNNWGGFLDGAVEIVSEFITQWDLIVTTKYKNKLLNTPYFSQNIGWIFDKKIVILINENSASASEIMAGALREYNKAILIWVQTYGKGSVQQIFKIGNGSVLKLTTAKWFTPQWKNIDAEGITPDIEVTIKKQDYNLDECKKVKKCDKNQKKDDFKIYDRQLEEAKKVLTNFIKKWTLQVVVDEENNRIYPDTKEDEWKENNKK